MNHVFEQQLGLRWPATNWADVTTLLAVSGGPDSMALLRAMVALRSQSAGSLVVVHFNHGLRGKESDGDEALVRQEARRLDCKCIVDRTQHPPSESVSPKLVSEDDARRIRYEFFCQTAKALGARYVVTAHTADDQAETILLRILRGTGLEGLSGIPFSRQLIPGVSLIRPLLVSGRTEILQYLESIGQAFRHDSTNDESRFTRNRLRNELIPQLERDYNPRVKDALLRLGRMAGESQFVIAEMVRDLKERCVRQTAARGAMLDCDALAATSGYLIQQLLMETWRDCGWGLGDMTWDHWRQLADLAAQNTKNAYVAEFPGKVRAKRDGDFLVLTVQESGKSTP
jgi:tRNA(Ile)-lysidine synthase